MLIAKTAKIIFLLTNHLVATNTFPRALFPFHQLQEAPDTGYIEIWKPGVLTTHIDGLGLSSRQDGPSCDRKAKCKKNKIRNPADDTKCIRCPPRTKPDPTKTLCVKDDEASDEDKRKQYEEKMKEKIKEKFNKFKEKIKERLDKKKEVKNKEWEEKDKQRQDKNNQKRFRRMAVCSPAVAASIGTVAMLELADGGFSEDLFDSIDGDMLEFWPGDDINEEWLDTHIPDDESDLLNEDYVNEFLVVGDAAAESEKRSIEKRNVHEAVKAIMEKNAALRAEKRNIFTTIANAFRTFFRLLFSVAGRAAGAVSRVTKYFANGKKPNLKKPGESKYSRAEQKDKAREISQNKNWKKCLRGEKPEK